MVPKPLGNWRPFDLTQERLDRFAARQPYRLLAGLAAADDCSTIQAALVVASGRGKLLTIKHIDHDVITLPDGLRAEWVRSRSNSIALDEMQLIAADVTDHLALAVESLKRRAGRYVDRIQAVSFLENDCQPAPHPESRPIDLCLPHRLAELTGLNVIDRFADRDQAAGGQGFPMAGWPLWLLLADRHRHVSQGFVIAVMIDRHCEAFLLPGSDGSETTIPKIEWRRLEPPILSSPDAAEPQFANRLTDALAEIIRQWQQTAGVPMLQIVVWLSPQAHSILGKLCEGLALSFENTVITSTTDMGLGHDAIRPYIAATLGALFIDQVPANVPELSGAAGSRILGRLTPGQPARWRDLLTTMAEHYPTPLPLRDAI